MEGAQNKWLGLLKWSLAHHDGTGPQAPSTMSEEDRKWLLEAMDSGAIDGGTEIIKKALADVATNVARYTAGDREGVVENLMDVLLSMGDMVDDIDHATCFHKYDGTDLLTSLVEHREEEEEDGKVNVDFLKMQAEACRILGVVAQNNEKVQNAIEELISDETKSDPVSAAASFFANALGREGGESVLPTAVSAVGKIVRGHRGLEQHFTRNYCGKILEDCAGVLLGGGGGEENNQAKLKRVLLFSLRAIVTSDYWEGGDIVGVNTTKLLEDVVKNRASDNSIDAEGNTENATSILVALRKKPKAGAVAEPVTKEQSKPTSIATKKDSPRELVVTNEWQKIPEGKSVPKGCEFKMNFETGENFVRLVQAEDKNGDEGAIVVVDERK